MISVLLLLAFYILLIISIFNFFKMMVVSRGFYKKIINGDSKFEIREPGLFGNTNFQFSLYVLKRKYCLAGDKLLIEEGDRFRQFMIRSMLLSFCMILLGLFIALGRGVGFLV